ncbi:MAG: hypothetical protein IIC00_15795 [Planctomycetes bacterium]|nr:hypothetical protein [Planctomycetota bacterium]
MQPSEKVFCKKYEKRITELEAELRWIPISEEMPLQVSGHWGSELVLATDGKQVWVCKYNFSAYYWTAPSADITHWMPITLPNKS